jgi:type II secretory pathway component PulK
MKEHSAMRRLTCLTGVTLVSTFAAGLAWSQDLTVWEKADRNEQQVAENMAA